MTSMLIFPCESDVGKNLPISYSWFHGDFLDNMVKAHIKREEIWLKSDRYPWQKLWYFRHVHLVGVRKPERMYNRRLRLFDSLVDKIRE